jgi:hypothetical protein
MDRFDLNRVDHMDRFDSGLTLEGDSGKEVALWLLTSLCTSAKREVEVAESLLSQTCPCGQLY